MSTHKNEPQIPSPLKNPNGAMARLLAGLPSSRSKNQCWEWQKGRQADGYGLLMVETRRVYTHRLSWELFEGAIPKGRLVLHKCDTPSCCNPDHLFLGTHSDNMKDMVAKGRSHLQKHPEKCLLGKNQKGERNPNAKLTANDVSQIRRMIMHGELTQRQIAKIMGVSENQIKEIKYGRRWK